jgi:hypothetical protein
VPPFVVEDTNEPRLGRPAPPEQRFGCRVVDDPAVADEKAGCAMLRPSVPETVGGRTLTCRQAVTALSFCSAPNERGYHP